MQTEDEKDPLLSAFEQGVVFAYPTEAVYGVGCDPDNQEAIQQLLRLKQRPKEKGLILIAKDYSQLLPYVDDRAIPMDRRTEIFSSWPGPVTWLLPKSERASDWITGGSELIAVRVTAHPDVQALCDRLGKAIISTSANITGQPPALSEDDIREQFGEQLMLVPGSLGGRQNPSMIRHGLTGEVLRAS